MNDSLKNFQTKALWVAIIIFAARHMISSPNTTYSLFGCMGESITITIILLGIYEKWIWKFDPFEKKPRLMGKYSGDIKYNYSGEFKKKKIQVTIKQSLLSVDIKITTNEIHSRTITSKLIFENDEYVLYYIYITNPQSKYSKENPMQYGTCRLIINNENELQGTYWTNRKTIGDIRLKKE